MLDVDVMFGSPFHESGAHKFQPVVRSNNAESIITDKTIFRDYAKECIEGKNAEWTNDKHTYQWFRTIEVFANPVLGDKYVDEVDGDDVLKILNPIWHKKRLTQRQGCAAKWRGYLPLK